MPRLRHRPFKVFPWLGGLNALNDPQLVPPTDCTVCDNIVFDRDGTKKLRGGSTKYNSTVLSGGTLVDGIFHYKKAASNADTFKTLAISNNAIYKADEDGVFDDITGTAFVENAINPDFTVFNNEVIISWNTANTASYNVLKWDQTGNVESLGGTPPDFAFSVGYNGRIYGAGDPGQKSRLYASELLDHESWTIGVDPQDPFTIDIQPNDGDKITGLASAFGALYIFKEFSIHQLQGTLQNEMRVAQAAVPTQEQGSVLAGEIGAINHHVIVPTGNDVFFISRRGIHSLVATDKFGDVEQSFISFKIQDFFLNGLNHTNNDQWRGKFFPDINSVVWAVTSSGASENDRILVYNIELKEWSIWNVSAASLGIRDVNGIVRGFAGGYDGFVRQINDQTSLSDDGVGYKAKVQVPVLDFDFDQDARASFRGIQNRIKKVKKVTFFYVPKGEFNVDVTYSFDNGEQQTASFDADAGGGAAVLGDFVLGTDVLGGGTIEPKSVLIEGVGKTFQMTIESSGVVGGDFELLGYQIDFVLGKPTFQNVR